MFNKCEQRVTFFVLKHLQQVEGHTFKFYLRGLMTISIRERKCQDVFFFFKKRLTGSLVGQMETSVAMVNVKLTSQRLVLLQRLFILPH